MDVRKPGRRRKGSAIAEFGPALFLFIIVIFFPMLDFLGLMAAYCAGWYCNFAITRELAVRRGVDGGLPAGQTSGQSNGGIVYDEVFTALGHGILPFVGIKSQADLVCTVNYSAAASAGQQPMVSCTTLVNAQPFISIPWWGTVPGLNAPMPFTIQSTRPREVTQ